METATDRDTIALLRQAAIFAGRAPSIHNSQPWRWHVGDRTLDLFLARSRVLKTADPDARLAVLSCGAALHHARVELAARGGRAVVRRLPLRADPDHLARITIDRRIPVEPAAIRMAAAAGQRQTDRRNRPSLPLDIDKLRTIGLAVRQEGCALTRITARQVYELAAAVDEARRTVAADPRRQAELAEWVGGEQPFHTGVPDTAMTDDRTRTGPAEHDLGRPGADLIAETHHRAAVFTILHGPGNGRPDWLGAGEALSAGWLTATGLDVSVLPLSSVIEVPAGRPPIRRMMGGAGYPYLILRFAAMDPGDRRPPPTPRLPATTTVEGFREAGPPGVRGAGPPSP
jgi:nitroreductase